MLQYSFINHEARRTLGLSMNEAAILDSIDKLSGTSAFPFCMASRETMSEWLGLTKKTICTLIDKATEAGLLEKNEEGNIRTTHKYKEAFYMLEHSVPGVKTSPPRCKNYTNTGVKTTPYINIDSNIINNTKLPTVALENKTSLAEEIYQAYIASFPKEKKRFFEKAKSLLYIEQLLKEFSPEVLKSSAIQYKKTTDMKWWESPQYFYSNSKHVNAKRYRHFLDFVTEHDYHKETTEEKKQEALSFFNR